MKRKFVAVISFSIIAIIFLALILAWRAGKDEADSAPQPPKEKLIRGVGYVRGRSRVTLKNKFAGFVSKVNILSQQRVKKGDVILEYDDLDLRTDIEKLEHSIAEQKKSLELKEIDLQLKRIDPLPSEYRNTKWKLSATQKRLERYTHELDVYKRLYRSNSVSELSLREKDQEVKETEADLLSYSNDLNKLKSGLADIYIRSAEQEVAAAKQKLEHLERELELMKEQQKYYRIVAPFDGLCITNSDVVHAYNSAGTDAAEVHRDDRKLIYAYFDEKDIPYIVEGRACRFRSNQHDAAKNGFFTVLPYQVKKSRTSYGDRCFFLVKFRVLKEPVPLRIDSVGTVEIVVPEE